MHPLCWDSNFNYHIKKMKKNKFFVMLCALAGACSSPSKDITAPEILPQGDYASPVNCQTFERGTYLPFAYAFSDDVELGSYNLEIHNNFDHHTHSTEAGECGHDEVKQPEHPWIYNQSFEIPAGSSVFEASHSISIPEDIDPGEYHFMIRVTDASGWQEIKSVAIRIL